MLTNCPLPNKSGVVLDQEYRGEAFSHEVFTAAIVQLVAEASVLSIFPSDPALQGYVTSVTGRQVRQQMST